MTEVIGSLKSPYIESSYSCGSEGAIPLVATYGADHLPGASALNVWTLCQDQALLVDAVVHSLNLDLPTSSAHDMSSDLYWPQSPERGTHT